MFRLLCAIDISLLLSSCALYGSSPVAQRGVLDLREWDFGQQGLIELRGEWEFHYGVFITPRELETQGPASSFIGCPSIWKGVDTGNGPMGPYGFATYRLRVLLPVRTQRLGVHIGDISGASRVFANGVEVAASGRIGTSAKEVEPDYRPFYFEVEASAQLDIVIHEANFDDSIGGRLWYPGDIGLASQIEDLHARHIILDFFVAGLIFVIAALFFVLFAFRRFDATSLIFACTCLGVCIYQINSGEHISVFIYPWIPYRVLFHVRFVILGSLFGLYALLFATVYPQECRKAIAVAISALYAICGVILPMRLLTAMLQTFHMFATIAMCYVFFVLIKAWVRRRNDAPVFALGLSLFLIATVNDTLVVDYNVRSIFLLPIGQSGFIFS